MTANVMFDRIAPVRPKERVGPVLAKTAVFAILFFFEGPARGFLLGAGFVFLMAWMGALLEQRKSH